MLHTARGNEIMSRIIIWILTQFFKRFYKIKPPETVQYYKTRKYAKARVTKTKEGALQMELEDEKYPFPGMPRAHILMNSLEQMKESFKEKIFHAIFEQVAKVYPDMMPENNLCSFVKELWRIMTLMEEMETTIDMRLRIKNMKKAICFFLQEDDSYRFRLQWAIENINVKKCKLSKADKYYARAKFWKADYGDPKKIINKARNNVLY